MTTFSLTSVLGNAGTEEPDKSYFSLLFAIPKFLNALWELIRSFMIPCIKGQDYKEKAGLHSAKSGRVGNSRIVSKYRSLASAASETVWLLSLFNELRLFINASPALLCDNLGVTNPGFNPIQHSRMKHIQIDLHEDPQCAPC